MFRFKQVTVGWTILSPFAKMRSFKNFIYFWGRFNQLEVFTKCPNGPIVTSSLFISILYSILILYTSISYIKLGDFSKAVPSYCITGLMVSLSRLHISKGTTHKNQSKIKTYAVAWNLALKDRMKWVPLLEFAAQKIYGDDRRPTAYNRICSECMDNTLKKFIITITVIMFSSAVALSGPVYTYLKEGSTVTLCELRIPFLTGQPEKEFIKLTVQELYDFSDQMEVGESFGKESGQRLTNIFIKIIYMDGYIDTFRDLTFWRLLLAPPSFTIAISVSIYSQFMLGYPAGYGIAVVSYVQMAVLCVTGENICERNERILKALYQFKWYLLPTKYQKDVMYMIQHLQNKQGLSIGPFGPLKVFLQKIYSFLMFLFNINA